MANTRKPPEAGKVSQRETRAQRLGDALKANIARRKQAAGKAPEAPAAAARRKPDEGD